MALIYTQVNWTISLILNSLCCFFLFSCVSGLGVSCLGEYVSCYFVVNVTPKFPKVQIHIVVYWLHNASINVKPEGGGGGGPRAYVGHLTFQKNFWSKSPPWGPKIGSNQIKYPHLFHQFILKMSSEK